ncbi:thiol-disulfide oxidoreductase DCC family protein [Aquisalinus luteolus]|uniref:thiol-disulfide oxidoreductase DCC family protein n=1 Tax=Aquisalinus luteolus TaxID=1566827 RepID=UPI00198267C2|nr:thiol-disulfide oxidoreductase DCC family protein [Aquisalinus luteolus]
MHSDHPVIVFDGVCNLCNGSVQFVLKRDDAGLFRFASVQSMTGSRMVREAGYDPQDPSTFLLVESGRAYEKSDAVIRILSRLNHPWPLISKAMSVVPRFIRDPGYRLVARNRYRLFGKRDTCMIPSPGVRERFLD